jgi:hypothetical protein
MSTVTTTYAASATVTCGVESTASSSTFAAGRESSVIDNTTNKYVDALLAGKIRVGTTPTANTQILVYVFAPLDDTPTYPDVMDGTDSAETITSAGVAQGFLKLAALISVDSATSDRDYAFGPVGIAQLFGGIMPPKWAVFVTHNTGVNLNSTAGNHFIKYTGVKYDVT